MRYPPAQEPRDPCGPRNRVQGLQREGNPLLEGVTLPEGHEEESAGRPLPSAEKAPADEAKGASVRSGAGTGEGAAAGCARICRLLNS